MVKKKQPDLKINMKSKNKNNMAKVKRNVPITTISVSANLSVSGTSLTWDFGNLLPTDTVVWTQIAFVVEDGTNPWPTVVSTLNVRQGKLVSDGRTTYQFNDGAGDGWEMPSGSYRIRVNHDTTNGKLVFSNVADLVIP